MATGIKDLITTVVQDIENNTIKNDRKWDCKLI